MKTGLRLTPLVTVTWSTEALPVGHHRTVEQAPLNLPADLNLISSRSISLLQHKRVRLAVFVVVSGLAVFATFGRTGLIDRVPIVADSIADWLVTQAAFDGRDPYAPVGDLAAIYEVEYVSPLIHDDPVHPRLPGALLLQAPMILTDAITASYWLVGLGLASVLLVAWLLIKRHESSLVDTLAFVLFALWSGVGLWTFAWVSQSAVIAGLLYLAISFYRDRGVPWITGIFLGMIAVLKPHWLLLVIPFTLRKRWRPVGIALGTFVFLNGVGLALFGIGVGEVRQTLSQTFDVWFVSGSNVSLASWVNRLAPLDYMSILGIHAIALIAWLARAISLPRHPTAELMGWAVVAVFLSPLAWPHYIMVCLPLIWLFLVTTEIPTFPRVVAGVGTLALWPLELGFLFPAGMILLLAAVMISPPAASVSPKRGAVQILR